MAEGTHVRPTHQPSSIPPNTSEVDARWPYVEPHALWAGMPVLGGVLVTTLAEQLVAPPLAALASLPESPESEAPPPESLEDEAPPETQVVAAPALLESFGDEAEEEETQLVAVAPLPESLEEAAPVEPLAAVTPTPSVVEAPVEPRLVVPPLPPIPLALPAVPLAPPAVPLAPLAVPLAPPVIDMPIRLASPTFAEEPPAPDSQGPSTNTPLPRPFAFAHSAQPRRSKAWLAIPIVLLGAWFLLRRSEAPSVASPLPPPKSEIHAARDLTPVDMKVPAPEAPAAPVPDAPRKPKLARVTPARAKEPARSNPPASKQASETVDVRVVLVPPEAELYRRGKFVGKSGVVVKLEPGTLRNYEVVHPGYSTQKLRVDGRKPELRVILKPQSPPAP